MILAAGRGERLRPLTDTLPKPLIDIAGRPLIAHQLDWLARAGVTDVVINLYHLGEQIEAAIGSGSKFGLRVRYSHELERLETGGGVRNALPLLGDAPFLILNGDIWTDFDFRSLFDRPHPNDHVHLVLTATPAHRDSGDFDLTGDRVERGDDRPLTYCGISVLTTTLFEGSPNGAFSLRDLFFRAVASQRASGERFSGRWIDVGSPETLAAVRAIAN